MKVFATTAIDAAQVSTHLPLFRRLAAQDRFRMHVLVEDAEDADFVLFLDGHQHWRDLTLRAITEHPLVRGDRDRAFLYNEMDQPWCAMPGLYVAMPRRAFDWQRQRPCSYLSLVNDLASAPGDEAIEPDLLFSYLGRLGHPVREAIVQLSDPRALIEDTSRLSFFGATTEDVARQKRRYAEVVRRSKFVLCPVGSGASSFRLFETLLAGRVPVILSDEWVEPTGPKWEEFSLRVPERKVRDLPSIMADHESRFPEMARAARKAWEDWFAPEVLFHRMIDGCQDLIERRSVSEKARPRQLDLRYLRLRARGWKGELKTAVRRFGRTLKPSGDPA
jgi:hypothetical protein